MDDTVNLRTRLQWAGEGLHAMPDPDAEWLVTRGYEPAHDLGRWWDAALRLEASLGVAIPPALEAACLANLQRLADNPDCLLMCRSHIPATRASAKLNPHNLRESLLAYTARIRWRDCDWSRRAARTLVSSMSRALQPDGHLDYSRFGAWGLEPMTEDPSHAEPERDGFFDATATSGRSIEALVWLHEATGDAEPLALAGRLAAHHLEQTTTADGSIHPQIVHPDNVGHNHSYHGTLRGLLLYGLATGQREYIERVERTYRHAVRYGTVKESGWAPHDLGTMRFPNAQGDPVGDPASAGDAAQLALWLATRVGCHDLWDDVARYVRARLLPMQLTPAEIAAQPPGTYTPRDMGAWTIYVPCHAGKGCTPDVHAAIIHSLCDIHQHVGQLIGPVYHLNLHLDHEDDHVAISSRRAARATVTIRPRSPIELAVRIPRWTPAESVTVHRDGQALAATIVDHVLRLPAAAPTAEGTITLTYDLPTRRTREEMPSGRVYTLAWVGDTITGIDPQDGPMPYYPAL